MLEFLYLYLTNQITTSQTKFLLNKLYYNTINYLTEKQLKMITVADMTSVKEIHPVELAKELGLLSTTEYNEELVKELCMKSIYDEKNKKNMIKYKNGNTRLINHFFGDVMKQTKGKVDPKLLMTVLTQMIDEEAKKF